MFSVGITGDFREMGKEMDGWMRTECETRGEKRRGGEVKEEKEWRGWGWNGRYSINEEWNEQSIFRAA